jgi:prephenate dehydrogenase
LVGVGLLGGSIGLAARERRLAKRVVGYVRREVSVGECQTYRVADEVTMDLAAALRGADLVILGTPLLQMRALAERMAPMLRKGTVVTDVGSVKAGLVKDLEKIFARRGARFVGSHPMAGGEKTGPSAAHADLFKKAVCVITPTPRSDPKAVRRLEVFWQALGGTTLTLPPETHDLLVARSSHLPHLVATALAAGVLDPAHPREQRLLCATGFRDTTRVASGSPEMWRDIVVENRGNLLLAMEEMAKHLKGFARLLRKNDPEALLKYFQTAKTRRDAWLAGWASPSSE